MPVQLPCMHDAIIIVSSCYVIAAGAPVICKLIGAAMWPLSSHCPITGHLGVGTQHLATRLFRDKYSRSWLHAPHHTLATSMKYQIAYLVTEQSRQNERAQPAHWHRQSSQKTLSHQEQAFDLLLNWHWQLPQQDITAGRCLLATSSTENTRHHQWTRSSSVLCHIYTTMNGPIASACQ